MLLLFLCWFIQEAALLRRVHDLEDELSNVRLQMVALQQRLKETIDWARKQALRTWQVRLKLSVFACTTVFLTDFAGANTPTCCDLLVAAAA